MHFDEKAESTISVGFEMGVELHPGVDHPACIIFQYVF